jgi:hypothetical protein
MITKKKLMSMMSKLPDDAYVRITVFLLGDHKEICDVESVSMNGKCIDLNVTIDKFVHKRKRKGEVR